MKTVSIRQLMHHFSRYLKGVKQGQRIIILERNIPVADIIPHNENIARPGWKREIKKVEIQGEPLSKTIIRNRKEQAA